MWGGQYWPQPPFWAARPAQPHPRFGLDQGVLSEKSGPHTHFAKENPRKRKTMATSLKETLETILVVDDYEAVLKIVAAILESANFRVLTAGSGAAALTLAEGMDRKIDLLLSDVEMPEMSGPDLGELLKKTRPDLRVMLMSGAPNGNLLVLNYGWAYIQKPFVPVKLIEMITEVLHSPNRSQPGGHEFDSRKDSNQKP
jgi:DNA-binding NtrC family response regulator